jgi:hypothetical protein
MERAASVHAPVVNRSAGARGVGQPKRRDGPQAQQVESQSELRPQMQLPQHQPQAVQLREQPALRPHAAQGHRGLPVYSHTKRLQLLQRFLWIAIPV